MKLRDFTHPNSKEAQEAVNAERPHKNHQISVRTGPHTEQKLLYKYLKHVYWGLSMLSFNKY